jgi:hypothetical protein
MPVVGVSKLTAFNFGTTCGMKLSLDQTVKKEEQLLYNSIIININ